ncbi:MAG: sulfatase-like hydrolase/transferase [Bacteroidota bacterium]
MLRYFVFYFVFWYIVFFFSRAAFIISIAPLVGDLSTGHILYAFLSGWLLDVSTTGYLAAIPVLLIFLQFVFQKKWLAKLNDYLVSFFIVFYVLIAIGELCLYGEWATKLNVQALLHFAHPAEVFQSATPGITFLFFGLVILFSWSFLILYKRKFSLSKRITISRVPFSKRVGQGLLMFLVLLTVDFILLRGGLKEIPISESDAYYSKSRTLNDVAVNPLWSLAHNVAEYSVHQEVNPYLVIDDMKADSIMTNLFSVDFDSSRNFLTIPRPNIVFIILESYSAFEIPTFGGDSFAMFLDSLSGQGMAFTNCFSSAYVSDQGIPAILSSIPSSPQMAVINETTKALQLPCINKDLKKLGYNSGFYFGGQLNYGNIKSYLYNMQFDVIRERKDFTGDFVEGNLGIHDKDMSKLFLNELNGSVEPFFSCWFTISSHSPYDIPGPLKQLVNDKQNPYVNTVVYTDDALREFFIEARKKEWYANTLFVIVADHSHDTQRHFDFDAKDFHHIPLLFYGDVIKPSFRKQRYNQVCSQLDIVPTLLHQLSLPADQYQFGKNILNPAAKHFAFYYFFYGTGFITDSCFASFLKDRRKLLKTNCTDSMHLAELKLYDESFLQKSYEDYLRR